VESGEPQGLPQDSRIFLTECVKVIFHAVDWVYASGKSLRMPECGVANRILIAVGGARFCLG
jgi:hypothetical protein